MKYCYKATTDKYRYFYPVVRAIQLSINNYREIINLFVVDARRNQYALFNYFIDANGENVTFNFRYAGEYYNVLKITDFLVKKDNRLEVWSEREFLSHYAHTGTIDGKPPTTDPDGIQPPPDNGSNLISDEIDRKISVHNLNANAHSDLRTRVSTIANNVASQNDRLTILENRFNAVIGREATVDKIAFDKIRSNLIQAVSTFGKRVYIHEQNDLANIWVINHNFDSFPPTEILILDSSNNKIVGNLDYNNSTPNTIIVHFDIPLAGRAYITA